MRKKHTDVTTDEPVGSENTKHSGDKKKSTNTKGKHWALVIMVSTFFLAMLFSLVTEIASSKTNIIIASLLLLLLIAINILFDGIAISVASCDLPPLLACASRKVAGAKTAIKLVKNSDKVNNFCADVIGDICGIVSGGCAITIVAKVHEAFPNVNVLIFTIGISSLTAALTVGGKAYLKTIAIKNSRELVLFVSRIIDKFSGNKNKKRKKRSNN